MSQVIAPQTIKTYEVKCEITGFLEGDLSDWPANIQDAVFMALEAKSKELEIPLAIVRSTCELAYNDNGQHDGFYIWIIASEVVARDERFSSKASIERAFRELVNTSALNGGKYH